MPGMDLFGDLASAAEIAAAGEGGMSGEAPGGAPYSAMGVTPVSSQYESPAALAAALSESNISANDIVEPDPVGQLGVGGAVGAGVGAAAAFAEGVGEGVAELVATAIGELLVTLGELIDELQFEPEPDQPGPVDPIDAGLGGGASSGDAGFGGAGSGDAGFGGAGSGDAGFGGASSGDAGSADPGVGDYPGFGDLGSGDAGFGDAGSGDVGEGD